LIDFNIDHHSIADWHKLFVKELKCYVIIML